MEGQTQDTATDRLKNRAAYHCKYMQGYVRNRAEREEIRAAKAAEAVTRLARRPETLLEWFPTQTRFRSWSQVAKEIPCERHSLIAIAQGKRQPNYRIRRRLYEITGLQCYIGPVNRHEARRKRYRDSREYLTDPQLRQACLDDPRKIREISGPTRIVCLGRKDDPCWMLAKSLGGPHLSLHFPNNFDPGAAFKEHWELAAGFPLSSSEFAAAEAERGKMKGPRIAIEAAKARLVANQVRRGVQLRRWAKQDILEKLALNKHHREWVVVCKVLGGIRRRYTHDPVLPTPSQIIGWCGVQLRKGGALPESSKQFLSALKRLLMSNVIEALIRKPIPHNGMFALVGQTLRLSRQTTAAKQAIPPHRPASKRQLFEEAKRLRDEKGLSFPEVARRLTLEAYKEDPRAAANAIRMGVVRLRT